MNKTNQLICAHSGLVYATLLGIGIFGVAGWLPLVKPSLDPDDLAALFEHDRTRIRVGMSILAFASVFWWSFSAAVAMQMKRIEGRSHPLTYVQMAAASGTVMITLLAAYFWLAAAFRPDLPPSTLALFSDFAWMTFIGAYPPGFLQNLSIGICILTDKRPVKIFPRWVGFTNVWTAILFVPGALLPFFKTGPFAWNGIIGFWLVATVFFFWIFLMWWFTVKAIRQEPTMSRSPQRHSTQPYSRGSRS